MKLFLILSNSISTKASLAISQSSSSLGDSSSSSEFMDLTCSLISSGSYGNGIKYALPYQFCPISASFLKIISISSSTKLEGLASESISIPLLWEPPAVMIEGSEVFDLVEAGLLVISSWALPPIGRGRFGAVVVGIGGGGGITGSIGATLFPPSPAFCFPPLLEPT